MTTPEVESSLTSRAGAAFTAYRDGDTQALHDLVTEVTPLLWHVARSCGLPTRTAEDVVQTTWLRLVEHVDTIEEPRAVLGWLCVTTRREAWRVQKAARTVEPVADLEPDGPTPHDPAAVVALHDEARRLWQHFLALSPKCQQILRVVSLGGAPDYAGLAQAMGVPIGSIGPTRGRCLAALRHALLDDPSWSLT